MWPFSGPAILVITDGIRYHYFTADGGYTPAAYANLARLKVSSQVLWDRLARKKGGLNDVSTLV
ncbi:MAG TPA: hypothetical protein PK014_13775 [Thermoanaerobaculia bacterium]|nr:hypothetical protein [Thermoanaerobaculia bacterium]HUM31109.1 hypothetical protein [Thermoanaerobaculia bacterium]HXK69465.1 hypothetical protein [Thermoanaerobaculia bacterium]